MAVELMMGGYRNDNSSSGGFATSKAEENAVQEAASGLESVEKLIRLLSQTQHQHFNGSSSSAVNSDATLSIERDCKAVADVAVSKFKRVISLLGRTRTGHARFRRGPLHAPSQSQTEPFSQEHRVFHATPLQQIPPPLPPPPPPPPPQLQSLVNHHLIPKNGVLERSSSSKTINFSYSSAANSFLSSLTGDAAAGESKQQHHQQQPSSSSPAPAFQITNLSQVSSAGKPPLSSSSLKRKCSSENLGSGKCGSSSSRCHCSKKSRKMRLKRVVRVPAISLKMADIPPDDYSWRKYGQKPIKGSPHPRGYYKCSSVRGCPARKHVERALDDPSMLVVTYEGEHNHSLTAADATNLILESS
ncbi:probable WRKY transcription factor 15 [Arachis stenosperma]|uniref:probable WRKY transcription factor 15 n=1 Tax=Arachis stenosperma TaxID=217475 RepID=UPI0025AB9D2F|nr:probable WRKY transcription factor 15 [Arachis stenosperma]